MSGQTVVHPRLPPRRRTSRADRWWGKAWVRAVEESAYAEADLVAGRSLARSGQVGAIEVGPGSAVAVVEERGGQWRVEVAVPVLDDAGAAALVETVAAQAGRVTALLAGDLPHELVEHAEEAGVELLPYGGELETTCSCEGWVDPCVHALAVLHQLTWLLEADPFVLLHLRGTGREELLARLHARAPDVPDGDAEPDDDDLTTAYDAAARAARLLEVLLGDGPPEVDHLL
ncbi:putative Zn finger protein [Nocardioides salarius]|uniref:Zn finger protein n=1 Tax=Nocardioides salarius TaxID=374513 RepID=A0ABS2MAB8_9ACTN|nr:SWIM zinc finger family protein [Nocardioides salarius]MBM7508128.1 putative Zn finger protein [Nocardioides salarius]